MSKDPAFLFYPGDWLSGTLGMTLEEKGAYMELLIYQFNHGPFIESKALRIIGNENWSQIKDKFILNDQKEYYNERLKQEQEKRCNYVESRRQSRTKGSGDYVRIYVVRDNVRKTYKIGSSVNPLRRYNELSNQINPAIMGDKVGERDITLIWYSEPVEQNIETKLHELFKNKCITGEWFSLADKDLKYIYENYPGIFTERTNERTENENENENKIVVDYEFVVKNYHSLCPKLNKVQVISDTRKGFMNARVGEYGMDKVISVLRMAGESEFLNGKNDKVWKADFEWIMRPTNFIKIMEGKYKTNQMIPKFDSGPGK